MVFSFWERVMRNGVGGCPRGMLSRVKTNVNGEGDAYYPFRPILAGKLASASLFGPCHGSHTQRCRPHASWSRRIDLTWEGYERLPRATFPLRFGEAKEREELVAAFSKTRYDARTALVPCALEGRVGGAGGVGIRRVDDAMEVVTDFRQRVLRVVHFTNRKNAPLLFSTRLGTRPPSESTRKHSSS